MLIGKALTDARDADGDFASYADRPWAKTDPTVPLPYVIHFIVLGIVGIGLFIRALGAFEVPLQPRALPTLVPYDTPQPFEQPGQPLWTPAAPWQAGWLRDALRSVGFDAIYSSTSGRARATAAALAEGRGLAVEPCGDLREIELGDWEGRLVAEVEAGQPEQFAAFWEAPDRYRPENGGESFVGAQRRVVTALERIVARHAGQTVLIVTHTVALKAMLAAVEGRPLARLWDPPFIHPTALCKVVVSPDGHRTIALHGDTAHFQDEAEGA